jgi:hypothetical protein
MGVFKLPKSLCKEINDAMAYFWWGDSEDEKKTPLVCLVENVCSKETGYSLLQFSNASKISLETYSTTGISVCSSSEGEILSWWKYSKGWAKTWFILYMAKHCCWYSCI